VSIFATRIRHIDREPTDTQEANMNFLITTAQFIKSLAVAAFFGLTPDQVSCRATALFWHILQEVVRLVFWGLLAGFKASQEQLLGHHLYLLGCPLEMVHSLRPLFHLLGRAV
jgi:hypothetical protein